MGRGVLWMVGGLRAGTDNHSGFPGDTDFSVQHPLHSTHSLLCPHQSLLSPDRVDPWPRVMGVSSFV